jgi:hypothetical protein
MVEERGMTDSKSVLDVMNYIGSLYQDVSRLLLAVDRAMDGKGFTPCWDKNCYWWNSLMLDCPGSWAPRTFTRAYKLRDAKYEEFLTFFSLYLTPRNLPEPVAVWGSARNRGDGKINHNLWHGAMAKNDNPWFVTSPCDGFLRELVVEGLDRNPGIGRDSEALAENFRRIEYAAVPMLSLTDEATVRSTVTDPLLRPLAG